MNVKEFQIKDVNTGKILAFVHGGMSQRAIASYVSENFDVDVDVVPVYSEPGE